MSRRSLPDWAEVYALAIVLLVFACLVVGPRVGLPFVGDDYVFIDKVRASSFGGLWSPKNSVDFGWYRPLSREVHFWVLDRIFGASPTAFRTVNIGLWVLSLALYAAILSRMATRRVAGIATVGVAALAFWGTPVLWISGSQDLWMLVFALLSFWLFVAGPSLLATLAFILALLSKETASVLPALLCAYLVVVEHQSVGRALKRSWSFWVILLGWGILHPTLRTRLLGGLASTPELEHRPPTLTIAIKALGACLNIDRVPHPQELDSFTVCSVLLSSALLAGSVYVIAKRHGMIVPGDKKNTLTRLAAAWAAIGWFPLLLPSIGWHAYYGCVGVLGAWFGLALWLESRLPAAIGVVGILAVLRGAQANTLSADWGDEAYIQRAGSALEAIRKDLVRQHPSLPPHSRVYFANIPYHIGLIAGESPALRVWYADSTLQAGYYSYYRPRVAETLAGQDYFFRFDSTLGMVEAKAGSEDVQAAVAANPEWEEDHDGLADLFVYRNDLGRAALEFEKLSLLDHRPDATVYAAVCNKLIGDTAKADSLFRAARARLRGSDVEMQEFVSRVESHIAGRRTEGR